jgi:hypothetical protein
MKRSREENKSDQDVDKRKQLKVDITLRFSKEEEKEEIKTPVLEESGEYDSMFDEYKRKLFLLNSGNLVDDCRFSDEYESRRLPNYLWNGNNGCRENSSLFTTKNGLGCCRRESDDNNKTTSSDILEELNFLVEEYALFAEHLLYYPSLLFDDLNVYKYLMNKIKTTRERISLYVTRDVGHLVNEVERRPRLAKHISNLIQDTISLIKLDKEQFLLLKNSESFRSAIKNSDKETRSLFRQKYILLDEFLKGSSVLQYALDFLKTTF